MCADRRSLGVAALVVTMAMGCGADDATAPPGPEDELSVEQVGIVYDEASRLVADLEVCVLDQDSIPCGFTDASGAFTMMLPANQTLALTLEGYNHWPSIWMLETGEGGREFSALKVRSGTWMLEQVMHDTHALDVTQAIIEARVKGDVAGYRFSTDPPALDEIYVAEDGAVDSGLSWTTDQGAGLVTVASEGAYDVIYDALGVAHCDASSSAGASDNSVAAYAVPGFVTYVTQQCRTTPFVR